MTSRQYRLGIAKLKNVFRSFITHSIKLLQNFKNFYSVEFSTDGLNYTFIHLITTVVWILFIVKIFLWVHRPTKNIAHYNSLAMSSLKNKNSVVTISSWCKEAGNGTVYICLNRHWPYSFLRRINYVERKATTAKSKHSMVEFSEIKQVIFKVGIWDSHNGTKVDLKLGSNRNHDCPVVILDNSWTRTNKDRAYWFEK